MQLALSRTIRSLKLAAKKLCGINHDISYSQALDKIAKTEGFVSWSLLIARDKSSQIKNMQELCDNLFQNKCTLLAAKRNVGKISLAINFSLIAAKENKKVVYISLNTSKKLIREKFAAANSAIAHSQFSKSEMDLKPEENTRIKNSLNEVSHLPIRFYENEFLLESIKSIASDKINSKCLIIIDYVQLIKCDAVEKAIFQLKNIAHLNNSNILFISQINDECEKNSKKITLNSLSGGKIISRHCDMVLSLHRDYINSPEADPKQAKLQVLKSRVNSSKHFDISFDPSTGICSW